MNGNKFFLDTNIIIGYLAGKEDITDFFHANRDALFFTSIITRMELLAFPAITSSEEKVIMEFLDCIKVIPINDEIETTTIKIRRACRLKLPDAIIAASAIHTESLLITKDEALVKADFLDFNVAFPDYRV